MWHYHLPSSFARSAIASAIILSFTLPSYAAIVRSDINYQLYRDFAENKGLFAVDRTNIPIYNTSGKFTGTMLNGIPMIDFSPADRNNGVAVAISPQYITSVAHNSGYGGVEFGGQGKNPEAHHFTYHIVDRNNYPSNQSLHQDYHIPRLHKLITEIIPSPVTTAGLDPQNYSDKNRFPIFLRTGSGVQLSRDEQGNNTSLAGAYQYLIAGTPTKVVGNRYSWIDTDSSLFENHYGPMTTYGTPGDSGSSLFTYDTKEKRWVQLAVLNFYSGMGGTRNTFAIARPEFITAKQQEDEGITHTNKERNSVYRWQANGHISSLILPEGKSLTLDIHNANLSAQDSAREKPSLNHGKNLAIAGQNAELILQNDIHQGAGTLYFNANVKVHSPTNSTWQGAGVIVEKDKEVLWQIRNPQSDRLSKLGEGTLNINGQGINSGDISVGQGIVKLNQQADSQGQKQAFNQIGIVSGRATVQLGSADQIDLNKLYFGFRGGRLDLNGNHVTANHIQNVDSGAQIVNHNSQTPAQLFLTGKPIFTANQIQWGNWAERGKDLYEYINPHAGHRTDYFVLKGNPSGYYPVNQTSNGNWEYLSSNRQEAINILLKRKNTENYFHSFNGVLGETDTKRPNGKMNVIYSAERAESLLSLTGGANLNGEFSVNRGKVLFSGKPTPHAYNHQLNQEVVFENDWQNSHFKATTFTANQQSKLYVGRNVSTMTGNFIARHQAQLYLGFEQGKMPNCRYSDYFGTTECQQQAVISTQNFANLPVTQLQGNITLSHTSQLHLGKSTLQGNIQAGKNTSIKLSPYAQWHNNGNSQIGNLILEKGSQITLNNAYSLGGGGERPRHIQSFDRTKRS